MLQKDLVSDTSAQPENKGNMGEPLGEAKEDTTYRPHVMNKYRLDSYMSFDIMKVLSRWQPQGQ